MSYVQGSAKHLVILHCTCMFAQQHFTIQLHEVMQTKLTPHTDIRTWNTIGAALARNIYCRKSKETPDTDLNL